MKSAVRVFAAALLAAWLLPVAAQSLDEPVLTDSGHPDWLRDSARGDLPYSPKGW